MQNVQGVSISGLKGLSYDDSVSKTSTFESRDSVTIAQEVDRVYKNVPDSLTVDLGQGTVVALQKTGFKDTVVWNPWIDKAKAMADFGDEEVCALLRNAVY